MELLQLSNKKSKEALDKLELAVFCDPFVNEGAIITDKQDDVYILQQQLSLKQQVCNCNKQSGQWNMNLCKTYV